MYDPFLRGEHPVGVRRITIHEVALADRPLPIEVWHPAGEAYRGLDVEGARRDQFIVAPGFPVTTQNAVRGADAVGGVFPLVMYFHGGYGHPLESTHLCTHLASHGYIVAAPSFPGDSLADLMPGADGSPAPIAATPVDESAARRPRQASVFIERIVSHTSIASTLDGERVGTMGFSMGGFTALAVNSVSRRPRAVFAMCPMWGQRSMVPQVRRLEKLLTVDNWERPVSTLILTGDADPMVDVDDMRLLHQRLPQPKRLFVLQGAGHLHWADGARAAHEQFRANYLSGEFADPEIDAIALATAMREFSELCSEQDAGDTARGLCLAHMDAELKGRGEARDFLDTRVSQAFARRRIRLELA
jgi:dienelactone hydrolase